MNDADKDDKATEREAAKDFVAEKRGIVSRKAVDPAVARRNAQAASEVAKALLVEPVPELPSQDVPAPATGLAKCGCGRELGHAVYGVCEGGVWYCPRCFMRQARDLSRHPTARAILCPTCHRESVDFSGHMRCPVCNARGARLIKAA